MVKRRNRPGSQSLEVGPKQRHEPRGSVLERRSKTRSTTGRGARPSSPTNEQSKRCWESESRDGLVLTDGMKELRISRPAARMI